MTTTRTGRSRLLQATSQDTAIREPTRRRRVAKVLVLGLLALAAVVTASVSLYLPTRTTQDQTTVWGDVDNPDRVNITVWITKVDPASSTMSVTADVTGPTGSLADEQGFFADDANLYTLTSLQNMTIPIKGGDYSPVVEQRFALGGMATDYPFDRYTALLEYHVVGSSESNELPIAITLYSTDPFFAIHASPAPTQDGGLGIAVELRRSTPTLVYASFVMILMLGLAGAATIAAYYTLKWRKGLHFAACGMMAGMLFALIPLRNAVPGSPPIGSVIDFASFFIAAITIAVSLIACVTIGYRRQLENDQDADEVSRISRSAYTKYLESVDN